MELLTFEEVVMLLGVENFPTRWQERMIHGPTFPKPIEGGWRRDDVIAWILATNGRSAKDDAIDLTREELEEENVSLSEELVSEICVLAEKVCRVAASVRDSRPCSASKDLSSFRKMAASRRTGRRSAFLAQCAATKPESETNRFRGRRSLALVSLGLRRVVADRHRS